MKKYDLVKEGIPLKTCREFLQLKKTSQGCYTIPAVIGYQPLEPISLQKPDYYADRGQMLFTPCVVQGELSTTHSNPTAGSEFSVNSEGVLIYNNGKDMHKIANFSIMIKARINSITTKDVIEKIRIHVKNRRHEVLWSIKKSDWLRFYEALKKEYPEFYIFPEYANARKIFQKYIDEAYFQAMEEVPVQDFYELVGWIEKNNHLYYISGSDRNCSGTRCLARSQCKTEARQLWNYAQEILALGPINTLLPLFLQAHIGYALPFFEKAGHQVQFILALIGPTGSKKTSLAKVLYCLFDIENVVNFTATDRGIELHAMQCRDAVAVLDDLNSAKDPQLEKKINRFLRQTGDSAGRVKSTNGGEEIERVDTRFSVVLTAEHPLDFLQQSAQLRILTVKIGPHTLNLERLRCFQEDKIFAKVEKEASRLEKYISTFIQFLEVNDTACLKKMISFRPVPLQLSFDRQAEVYWVLSCAARLVADFGVYAEAISQEEADFLYFQKWIPALQQIMIANELASKTSDPIYMFLQAVSQLLATKQLVLADRRELFQSHPSAYAGFCENERLNFKPDVVYESVCQYWAGLGYSMEAPSADLFSKLYTENISEGYEQKGHAAKKLKTITVNKERMKVLCIKWENAKKYLEVHEDLH